MARDRVSTSAEYRNFIDDLKKHEVLGLQMAEGKDIFMLAVALGLNEPAPLKSKVGLFLCNTLKTADKALMESVLLGSISEDSELDELADFDKSAELCEQCAETGYQVLRRKYTDAECDAQLLERRMLKELEFLYKKNVEGDI